jgi:hypothetical protein
VLIDGESLGRDRESTPDSPERIVAATAMPTGLVLHPPTHLVESGAGELNDVEKVSDLDRQREHRVECVAVAGRQIKRRPLDPIPPLARLHSKPSARFRCCPAGHDIEELASAHVDDLRRPRLRPVLAKLCEQSLVETERRHVADPIRMVNELLTDRDDGAHHGVPAAAKFACHIRYSPSVAADMQRRPTSTNARPESSTLTTPTRFRDRRRTSSSRRLCSASVACATPIWSAARTLAGIGCIGVRAGRLAFCFGAATSRLRVMPIRVDSSWRPP